MTSLALIGCGSAKREVTGNPNYANNQYRTAVLYISNYFKAKREYGERMCDYWYVLSAKHGLRHPFVITRPYDVRLTHSGFKGEDEAPFESIAAWADHVIEQLEEKLTYLENSSGNDAVDEVVILAGRPYVDPLREPLDELDVEPRYPFDDTSGLPEQMKWMSNHTDPSKPVSTRYQAVVAND